MMRTLVTKLTFIALATLPAAAESPITPGSELKLISAAFELADGPAWDGWSLTVPDPLGQEIGQITRLS